MTSIGLKLNDSDLKKLDKLCEIFYQSRAGMAAFLIHVYADVEIYLREYPDMELQFKIKEDAE